MAHLVFGTTVAHMVTGSERDALCTQMVAFWRMFVLL